MSAGKHCSPYKRMTLFSTCKEHLQHNLFTRCLQVIFVTISQRYRVRPVLKPEPSLSRRWLLSANYDPSQIVKAARKISRPSVYIYTFSNPCALSSSSFSKISLVDPSATIKPNICLSVKAQYKSTPDFSEVLLVLWSCVIND
jgi:hypothetical protein